MHSHSFRSAVLAALFLLSLLWQPASAFQKEDSKNEQKAVKACLKSLTERLAKGQYADAEKLMTTAATKEFATSAISEFAIRSAFGEQEKEYIPEEFIAEFEAELKTAKQLIKKHGFDQVSIPEFDESMEEEDFRKLSQKLQENIWKILEKKKDKWKVTDEFLKETPANLTHFLAGSMANIEVQKDVALVEMAPDFSTVNEEAEMAFEAPNVAFRFVKKQDQWLFDGLDDERTMQLEEEFMESFGGAVELKLDDMTFAGQTISKEKISQKDFAGKVVLMDFWGTWCGPCVASLPKLEALNKVFADEPFAIVGIANDSERNLKKFFEKRKLPWKNIVDGGELSGKFGVNMYPTTLLVDKAGNHIGTNLHGRSLVKAICKALELSPEKTERLTKAWLEIEKKNRTKPATGPDSQKAFDKADF